jgi:hypothetical protein
LAKINDFDNKTRYQNKKFQVVLSCDVWARNAKEAAEIVESCVMSGEERIYFGVTELTGPMMDTEKGDEIEVALHA